MANFYRAWAVAERYFLSTFEECMYKRVELASTERDRENQPSSGKRVTANGLCGDATDIRFCGSHRKRGS